MTVVSHRKSLLPACALLAVGLFLIGCGKPEHATTEVEPATGTIRVGEALQLEAVARDPEGEAIADTAFQWSVEGDSATIDDKGLLTARAPGEVKVIAAAEKVTGSADITILRQQVASLVAAAEPTETTVGGSVRIQVTAQDSSGQGLAEVEIRASTPTSGAGLDRTSAVTDETGRATFALKTADKALMNRIEVSADDETASIEVAGLPGSPESISVESPRADVTASETVELRITVKDRAGNGVPGAVARFAAASTGTGVNPAQAETDATGQATVAVQTSVKSGTNTIEITVPGVPGTSFSFDTQAGPPARLVLTPSPPVTVAGGEIELSAKVTDAHGNPVPDTDIALASPTQGLAVPSAAMTTNQEGVAEIQFTTAKEPGVNEVTASIPGLGDVSVSITGNPPTSLKVEPENTRIAMRGSQEFQALAMDDDGNRAVVDAGWSVVGDGGSIDPQGVFEAEALGDDAVVAAYRGLTGGATLTVVPGPPATVELSPQGAEVVSGQNQQFSARIFNAHGYPLDITPQWSVSGEVGTTDASGLFSATKAGTGTVDATAGDASARAQVTVTPGPLAGIHVDPTHLSIRAGEEVRLAADGRDAGGNSVPIDPTWSLTADLGVIDPSGSFRAQHVGSGTIRVAAGSPPIIAEIPVVVVTAALARIEVEPMSLTVSAGDEHVFRATGFDASNNALEVTPAWTVSEDVGTIDAGGKLLARRTGTATVRATVDELVGSASVTVKPGALASLEIEPPGPLTLQAGATTTFKLIGKDSFGNAIAVKSQWVQSQPLGRFEPEGPFRATTAGTAQLIARAGDQEASVEITVVPGKLASIDVEPGNPEVTAGSTIDFSAAGRDAYGNDVPIEPTWRLTEQIGEITADGVFTALQARSGEAVATAEGVSGSAAVSVFPDKLTLLKITPLRIDVEAGDRLPIDVVGYDSYGNPVPTHPVWKIPDELGTIDTSDTFTAGKVGEGRIIVAAGTLAAVIDTKVSLGKATRLEIVSTTTEIRSGDTGTFTVEAFDGGGNPVEAGDTSWEVEGPIGNIDESGVFTATVAGKGRLVAKAGSLVAGVGITVTPGSAASLELIPESADMVAGQVLRVLARAMDAAGNEIERPPGWSVEGQIGEMFDHGIFKATTASSGKILASLDGVTRAVPVTVEAGRLARIEITPGEVEMEAGEETGFGATGYDAFGNIRDLYPSWSLQGGIGTLDPIKGVFKATKAGTGFIVASDQFVAGLARIQVGPGEVARLEVVPGSIRVKAGQEVPLRVNAYDEYGNAAAPDIDWKVTKRLGTIEGSTFRPTKIGWTEIIAAHDYITATARVEVELGPIVRLDVVPEAFTLEAGKSFRAAARGYDEFENVTEVPATWRIEGGIGTVDAGSGVFTAGREGQGSLVAQVGDLSAESLVTTVPGPVERISVQPEKVQISSTEQEDFRAIGIDAGGNERPVAVRWAVNSHLGEVDENGRFVAKGLGSGPIVAYQDGGLIGTAEVAVSPGPVVLMFVTPQPTTVRAGDTSYFEVKGYDANRNPVPDLSANWRTVGQIGEIDQQTGAFTGTFVGWGKVQASVGQTVGDADVKVTPGTPSPTTSRMTASRVEIAADGETATDITLLVRDRYGNPIEGVPVTLIARTDDQIEQPGPTNEAGITVGRIRSSKMGISEVSAIVGSVRIQNTLRLRFYLRRAAARRQSEG